MKVGDLVKVRKSLLGGSGLEDSAGIIQSIQTAREICGPNGDFFIERHYTVLLRGKLWRCHENALTLVSES
tara:strand:- start:118 stop:330 length:213 start_codon:yes stop_codon:yes gene_type:complete